MFSHSPGKRSTWDAIVRSGPRCSSPLSPDCSRCIWAQTCQSSPSCSMAFRPAHGSPPPQTAGHIARRKSAPYATSSPAQSRISGRVQSHFKFPLLVLSLPPPYIQNSSVAISAPRTKQVVVVLLTVRLSVPLEEVLRAQLLVAVAASKVLRVPRLAQCRDHLTHNRLLASVAAPLLRRRYSAPAHVRVQIAEHRVQLVALGQGSRRRLRYRRVLNVRHALVWLRVVRHRLHLMAAAVVAASVLVAAVHLQVGVDGVRNQTKGGYLKFQSICLD